jgi:hypothetical protein
MKSQEFDIASSKVWELPTNKLRIARRLLAGHAAQDFLGAAAAVHQER